MVKFALDVLTIQEWIAGCKTEVQIRNLENLYRTIISKQWYPLIDDDSLEESMSHLNRITDLQIGKIERTYESHFS